ncbi:hypothetical protein E3P99_01607 [Wallemia hederae]|uniref:Uncharacterized protein n=1 Tax=Wallemia hederae TaxID=1540922 RepID=A0A4V4LTG5_9BASI|nr:hypothetical protein E3P99_01607 [Wallemia hederae]
MVSLVTSIRDCERFRGEILKEISRKVDKIQDAGLTDYEVRDLNDEINGSLREKANYERQIVALGGANYRRAGVMLDESGKEIPGTRGYKYFGRAKELPGVKELFERTDMDEEAEDDIYKPFTDQGPDYYGDTTEQDEDVLEYEREMEEKATQNAVERLKVVLNTADVDADAYTHDKPRPLQALMDAAKENKLKNVHSDFIDDDFLEPPRLPTKQETDKALLDIQDESIGGVSDAQKRTAAGEKRRLIEVNPAGTLRGNQEVVRNKMDEYKLDLLGTRKRKSKRWQRDVDPNVIQQDVTDNADLLPSANIMKMINGHVANYYSEKGILGKSTESDDKGDKGKSDQVGEGNDLRQDMSYAFDGSALVCMGILFEELVAHYSKGLLDEDDVREDLANEVEIEAENETEGQTASAAAHIDNVAGPSSHVQSNTKTGNKASKKQAKPPVTAVTLSQPQSSQKTFMPESEDDVSLASDHDVKAEGSRSPSIPSIRSHSSP